MYRLSKIITGLTFKASGLTPERLKNFGAMELTDLIFTAFILGIIAALIVGLLGFCCAFII